MILSTLCYIEKEECYLVLHRVSKQNDPNKDKYIGIGGKFEAGESPQECLLREVKEETGLTLTQYQFRAIITFVSDQWETEYMHLFTAPCPKEGVIGTCTEGKLLWVDKEELLGMNLWEGDKIFLKLLQERNDFFSLKLCYQGEKLVDWKID